MSFERGFPVSEYEARVQKAQVLMHEAGMDALLFMTQN